MTEEGRIVGTPLYMAPEQLRGEPLDGRAGQFAWAVTAYELLSGRHPWDRSDMLRLAAQIAAHTPPSLRDVAPSVPAAVSDVVARALEKDPNKRFKTMDDLLAVLEGNAPRDAGRILATEVAKAEPRPSVRSRESSMIAVSQLRGSTLHHATAHFQERHGNSAAHAVIAALPASMRGYVTPNAPALGILGARNYPYPFVGELVRTMRTVVKAPDEDLFVRGLVDAGLATLLRTMHRVVLRYLVSPSRFIDRGQAIWDLYHTSGRLNVLVKTATSYAVQELDWSNTDPTVCKVNLEGRRRMLELVGLKSIEARREKCRGLGRRGMRDALQVE